MSKFKLGDKIRVRTSGKIGTVKTVYEGDDWNMSENEYGIDFDDGSGVITIVERVLEREKGEPRCTCGALKTRNPEHHSRWCDLYEPN